MKLPSAMLRNVAAMSGVPDAVVFREAAIEDTCMKFYLQNLPLPL